MQKKEGKQQAEKGKRIVIHKVGFAPLVTLWQTDIGFETETSVQCLNKIRSGYIQLDWCSWQWNNA